MRTLYNQVGPACLAGLLLLVWQGSLLPTAGAEEKLKLSGPGAEHFLKAVQREDKGQHEAAVREYQAYIAAKPSIPYPYYYLGNLYHDLGQTEAGQERFRKGAKASPG